jgi:GT2 family glycosyltransferase
MKPLSLVIITYNRPDDALDLARNIAGLEGLDELVEEVIFLNNRSTMDYGPLEEFINAHPAIPFRYRMAPENLGVSRGRNFAVTLSRSPYLVFLDDDALFRNSDALKYIVPVFEEDPGGLSSEVGGHPTRPVGIVAFKIYYASSLQLQQNAFPHKRFSERKDWPHFDTAYFSGAAHAIRRTVFDAVGDYPASFFYGMEEYDLSYRAIDAGYSIRYDNRVVILHKESPAGRLPPREKLRGMWVNKSKVAWAYLPKRYFRSTALFWSLEYLKKSGFDLKGFFVGWAAVLRVPGSVGRRPIGREAMEYLRRVRARLSY